LGKISNFQTASKAKKLPIILPIVLYHGRKKWEISTQFSGIIEGPFKAFKEYVPDFKYILFDLTQYTDEQIKGNVQTQLALLLLKYILDPDLLEKLPDILSLLSEIINQDTGLQTLEVLLRYLYSTIEDKNMDKVKNIFEQTLSNKKGVSAMATIAEKFINEGIQQGLHQAIELGLELKFGDKGLSYVQKIKNITDIQKLENIVKAIKLVKKLDELDYIIG
jgi:hypothetical protein